MDRRDFLKQLGLLVAGAALLPKGRSMVGWTQRLESGLYVQKTYSLGFSITREMLEDDAWMVGYADVLNSKATVLNWEEIAKTNKAFHGETPKLRILFEQPDGEPTHLYIPPSRRLVKP